MAGSNIKLLLFGGAGVAAWWFFFRTPDVVAPAAIVVDPNAITGANTLDGVWLRTLALAKPPAEGYGVDEWNWFVMQAKPDLVAPDPMAVFGSVPGFDRSQKISGAQYWAAMAPYLRSQMGMTGLGIYYSLARMGARC